MYCKKCGEFLPEEAEYCPSCGTRTPRAQQTASAGRGGNSIIIAAIAAVAAVLAVCIICFTFFMKGQQQPEQTAAQLPQTAQTQDDAQAAASDSTPAVTQPEQQPAQQPETQPKEQDSTSTVTNNYYYYGSGAARDNDYYTRVQSSGYLWPTDSQYISTADLRGLSKDTVAAIRNEIYARHGYAFTTSRWQNYFAAKSWYYRDSTCTESTIRARLSSTERANLSTIVSYEESMGWR